MKHPRLLLALGLLLAIASSAAACSIPVFRYALERWELTTYEILVYHKEPLTAEAKAMLKKLEAGPPRANIRVETLDIGGKLPKAYQELWDKHGQGQALPWVAARLTDAEVKAAPAWSGPLEAGALKGLVESPLRHKIIDRLKTGETAAFIVLASGDKEADDRVQTMLEKELARLEKAIELPEQKGEGPQLKTNLPLKAGFSVHRLNRDDPAEQAFLKIIFSSEEDLDKQKGPIVLPVFGRGRLLCSLFGKDLEEAQLANVARFLCGECSCQIKELNPGVDLLVPADWNAILEKIGPPANAKPDTPAPGNKKKN